MRVTIRMVISGQVRLWIVPIIPAISGHQKGHSAAIRRGTQRPSEMDCTMSASRMNELAWSWAVRGRPSAQRFGARSS